jgi:hypothetical protein
VTHTHIALASPDGSLAAHNIFLKDAPPLTLEEAVAGGQRFECDAPYCYSLQFVGAHLGNLVTLTYDQWHGKKK